MDANLAVVAACAVLLVALVLAAVGAGWSMRDRAAVPELALEHDRRERAELERDESREAFKALVLAETGRRKGGQADADHDAALRDELVAAAGDPRAAALGVLRRARAREAARAAADQAAASGVVGRDRGVGAGGAGPA
jgi:hypothetical protein